MVRSSAELLSQEGQHIWDYVILDEGHYVKNANNQTSQSLRTIASDYKVLLSGTPVQNTLAEIWALYDYVTDGELFGSYDEFKRKFELPITKASDRDATAEDKQLGDQLAEELRCLTRPFFLRREKKDVFPSAPETQPAIVSSPSTAKCDNTGPSVHGFLKQKHELVVWSYLTAEQQALYESFLGTDEVSEVRVFKSRYAALEMRS